MSHEKDAIFAAFKAAATLPPDRWRAEYPGQPVAVFCSYVPEELLHAAGFVPVRLRKQPPRSGAWSEHLQSYACPLARSLLEQGAEGQLAGFAGAVFAHSCDAMQALADIWHLRFGDTFAWVVNVPTRLDGPHAAAYLVRELAAMRAALERHTGRPIGDEDIRAGIALCNRVRALLACLDALRDRISNAEYYAAILAAQTMPKETFIPLAESLIPRLEAAPPRRGRARVIVVGAILDDLTVPALADDVGLAVVGDDLCTGTRYFEGTARMDAPPLEALAERFLTRTPCAAKHRDDWRRGQALRLLAQQRGARGVVFYLQKFCEPHAFDYADARRDLEDAGIPHIVLEDDTGPATAQWRTRLQAFAEMLGGTPG
ncbi:MAG: 2-hydroxyacyl-CoA dehydratase [Chloroflexi bacterium]|nr:2-hydroxyacyl-CoA dehydratase [Chloroflexota bacterium]